MERCVKVALLSLFVCAATVGGAGPVAGTCGAAGQSDGNTASAAASCTEPPDGVILEPLVPGGCEAVDYELAISDDSETAVFPEAVVQRYRPTVPDTPSADGFSDHYGTIVDPLRPGAGNPSPVGLAYGESFGDRLFSESGRWWRRICRNTGTDGVLSVDGVDGPFPEGPVVPLSELVTRAEARINPDLLPPIVHAGPASIMQIPTWFWVDEDWWERPIRASERHGRVGVTVTGTPDGWVLSADGQAVLTCEGRGRTWRRGLNDRTGCTHTFTEAIPGGSVELTTTVQIGVEWTTTLDGYGAQSLTPIERRVRQPHAVIEVIGLRGLADR